MPLDSNCSNTTFDNNSREKTEWHRVSLFNRLAVIGGHYLHKGSKVYIEGKLQTRKWQNQQGNNQYTTEIIANNLQMLDSNGTVHVKETSDSQESIISEDTTIPEGIWEFKPHFEDDIPFK